MDSPPACGDVLGGARPSGWPGTEDELDVLRSGQLFRGLDPDDVAALLPAFAPRTLERGAQLFAQGDVDEADVFVVLSGRFTVAREHRDGRAVTAVLGPGDMVGELSVFDPGPRTSTVTAVTAGRVAALTSSDLLAWGTSRPHVAARLLQVLARRLRRTNSTVVDLMFVDVAGRMAKAAARARGPVRTATRPRGVGIARADPSRARPARRRLPGDGKQDPVRVRQPRLAPARKPGRRPSRPTPPRPTSPRRRLSRPARCIASRGKQLPSGLPLPAQPVPAGCSALPVRS
jgi:CRP-like cAMP-binding protein